jgi:MFS family permease
MRRRRLFAEDGGGVCAIALSCLCVFVAGGLPFGISSLYPVLYSEDVLAIDSCGEGSATVCAQRAMPSRATKCCNAQMLGFTALSSAALLPTDGLLAVYGEFVDRHGPRKTFLVGMAFACTGLGLLALNTMLHVPVLWFVCFACLGASGPGVFFSVLFLAEKHPTLQPLITTLASATYDGSAACFFLFNRLYFAAGMGLRTIALIWLVFSVSLCVATVGQLPSWTWLRQERLLRRNRSCSRSSSLDPATAVDVVALDALEWSTDGGGGGSSGVWAGGRSTSCGGGEVDAGGEVSDSGLLAFVEPLLLSDGVPLSGTPKADKAAFSHALVHARRSFVEASDGSCHGANCCCSCSEGGGSVPSASATVATAQRTQRLTAAGARDGSTRLLQLMLRADTLLLVCTMCVANLKATTYITSFSETTRTLFPETVASHLDTLFNVGFPCGSLLTSPIASLLLRRFRTSPHVYLTVALCGQLVFGLCTTVAHPWAQAAGALLFGPTRTLLWSSYFHYLAQPRRYPRALAGRTLGYCNLAVAVASDLPPYAINWYVKYGGGTYLEVARLLLSLLLCCAALPAYLILARPKPGASSAATSTLASE